MPRKLRELRAGLRRAGATVVDQEGSHEKWAHPLVPDYHVITACSSNGLMKTKRIW